MVNIAMGNTANDSTIEKINRGAVIKDEFI